MSQTAASARGSVTPETELRGIPVPEALNRVDAFARKHLRSLVNLAQEHIAEWSYQKVRERKRTARQLEYYTGERGAELTEEQRKQAEIFAPSDEEIERECRPLNRLKESIEESKKFLCDPGGYQTQDEALASMEVSSAAFAILQSFVAHDQDAHLAERTGIDAQVLPWNQFGEWLKLFDDDDDEQPRSVPVERPEGVHGPEGWRSEVCGVVADPAWLRVMEVALDNVRAHIRRRASEADTESVLKIDMKQRVLLIMHYWRNDSPNAVCTQDTLEFALGVGKGRLDYCLKMAKEEGKLVRIRGTGCFLTGAGYGEAAQILDQLRVESESHFFGLLCISRHDYVRDQRVPLA